MTKGGFRVGSGRKLLSGQYHEETKPIRIPVSRINDVKEFLNSSSAVKIEDKSFLKFPLYQCAVSAGFPSPADDYIEKALDLNDLLIKHPAATFFVRVAGDSMTGAGMYDNDILVVDRSLTPKTGDIVIAVLNGELTVKRLKKKEGGVYLLPENPNYRPIKVTEEMGFSIWGVVTTVLHSVH